MKKSHALSLLSVVVLTIFILFALGSGDTTEPEAVEEVPEEEEVEEPEEEPEEELDKIFGIGDTVAMGELEFTLHGVRWFEGGEFMSPDEGKKWLLIDATVENKSDEEKTISSMMMFTLYDDEHRSTDIAVGAMSEIEGQLDGDLGGGRKMRGELAFEVPEDSDSFELIFEPDFLGFGQAIFEFNKEEVDS